MTEAIRVEGAATLAATLRIAARRLEDSRTPSRDVAAYVGTRGRSSAPVRTGRLAASVSYAGAEDGAEITSGLAYANRTHWGYARYRQRAQPFIAEQVWNDQPRIVGIYADWTDDVLGAVKGTA